MSTQSMLPLFSFGLLTDIQYADADMRLNYTQTEERQYREALRMTQRAVVQWSQQSKQNPVSFVVHLGDLIDGLNASLPGLEPHQSHNQDQSQSPHQSNRALRLVQTVLEGRSDNSHKPHPLDQQIIDDHAIQDHPRFPVYHVIGNHDLYCGHRNHWLQQFGIQELKKQHAKFHQSVEQSANPPLKCMFPLLPREQYDQCHQSYYAFHPHPSYTCIMLDAYDISTLGHEPIVDQNNQPVIHPHYEMAAKLLNEKNPNEIKDSPVGMRGLDKRFVRFNGGIGANQLHWLRNCLNECQRNNQRVLIFSHIPVHPRTCNPVALLWNYQDVLDLLAQFGCVKLFAAGHDHEGGHVTDGSITHFTAPAVISAPVGRDRFGRVDCYDNKIDVVGVDLFPSFPIKFQ